MELGRQLSERELALARNLYDVQTNLLNGIESVFEYVHPMPLGAGVSSEPLPDNHLLSRIDELENELAKSQSSELLHTQTIVELREKLRSTKVDLDSEQANDIKLQAEIDELKRGFVSREGLEAAQIELLDLRAEVVRLQEWNASSVPRVQLDESEKEKRSQQERISNLMQQLAAMKVELAENQHAREEARIYLEKTEQLKTAMQTMISQDDLLASETSRALLQKELSELRVSMVTRRVHDEVVEERELLNLELERWKNKSNGMVPKTQLDLAQVEVERLQVQVFFYCVVS